MQPKLTLSTLKPLITLQRIHWIFVGKVALFTLWGIFAIYHFGFCNFLTELTSFALLFSAVNDKGWQWFIIIIFVICRRWSVPVLCSGCLLTHFPYFASTLVFLFHLRHLVFCVGFLRFLNSRPILRCIFLRTFFLGRLCCSFMQIKFTPFLVFIVASLQKLHKFSIHGDG